MTALILYIPRSDHGVMTERYLDDFKRDYPDSDISLMDAESREGISKCGLYDIFQYPSIIVFDQNMVMQNSWIGKLPPSDEIMSYMR